MQRPSTPRQRHRSGSQRSSSLQSRSSSEATFFSPRQTSPKKRRHHEETRGDAQHFYSLRAWKRWCLGAILRWELVLRAVFVEIPTMVFHRIEGLDKVVAFFFVYVMLQALAILWGFLFNVGAILGDNMISILMMPYVQAICVLLTHVSVIGIVLSFGRATWILTWQSTQNFPMIRRIIAQECRPQSVIVVAALPMLVLLPSLIVVPIVCAQAEDDMGSWTHAACKESYLKFVTDKHPMFQRSLRLATNIAIWQFIQACLEILPRWRAGLSELSMLTTFVLGGLLFSLNTVGVMWGFEWLARHVKYHATPLSDLTAAEWELFGLGLLTAWILWFLFLTWCTSDSRFEGKGNQRRLVGFFERLKYTFVVGQAIIFFRACIHPDMGFVHAQLELTIINLLLPSIYVISLVVLRMMTQMSWTSVTLNGPVSLVLASGIYVGSKMTHRPHSFFVVALFLFDVSLRTTDAVYTLSRKGRVPQLLQQMLQKTTASIRKPPTGHGLMKKMVMLAFIVLFVFVAVLAGFSVLSVLQTNAKWFPDATSIVFHDESTVEIHHTAIVKLHLGLANTTNKAMHVDIPRYASCSNKWNGLDIVDYALLAEAAYFDPLSLDIERFVSTVFNHDLGEIMIRLPALNTKTGSKLDFYEAFIPLLNTSVISVRGTDIWRFTDFIEDVKMFIEPVIFTILSLVFPTIRIWPDVTFSTLIELYGELIALFGLQHEFWYYHELLEYVASIQDRDVVLTGHSMGGGIARLVGSILGKTSVTFSPPGFVQSYSKLVHDIGGKATKVDRANLHHRSVTVVPEYDPITLIDAQAGMIQKISCNTPHLSMQLSCHMLEGTLCNLLEHCGDARNRIASCKFEHKITSLTEDILPKLTAVMRPEAIVTVFMITSIIISVLFRRRRRKPSLQSEYMDDLSPGRGRQMSAATQRRHFANAPKQAGSQRRNSVI